MTTGQNNIKFIWESFIEGDKEAFACLYNLHVETLFRYGTKLCSDESIVKDAIQDIFIDLYLKRKNNSSNPYNLKYYLILALNRNLIKKLKRNRRLVEETCDEVIFEPVYCIEDIIVEREEKAELNKKVNETMKQLSSKEKEALYLRFNQSLEYSDIAEILNISVESSRKYVYRALKNIREIIRE